MQKKIDGCTLKLFLCVIPNAGTLPFAALSLCQWGFRLLETTKNKQKNRSDHGYYNHQTRRQNLCPGP